MNDMNDIVERLRRIDRYMNDTGDYGHPGSTLLEAAGEIAKLRETLQVVSDERDMLASVLRVLSADFGQIGSNEDE